MIDTPAGQNRAAESLRPGRAGRVIRIVLATVPGAAGTAAAFHLFLAGRPMEGLLTIQCVVCAALLMLLLGMGAGRRREWSQPVSTLQQMLEDARRGKQPIESLSHIGGRLGGIALICQDLLRELRTQRATNAQLHEEIRQRVAGRTEALERAMGTLRHQASHDPLTGLLNRRVLDAYLSEAIDRCQSSNTPLCLLMIDIDHFKPVNDTLGHAAGDEMLRTVAQLIRSTIREVDLAFRCGGDEFVILLERDEQGGRAVAERLASLGNAAGRTYRVPRPPTLSIGIATLAGLKEPTPQALLHRADAALYRIKSSRRPEKISA